jgi:hypothetical protein
MSIEEVGRSRQKEKPEEQEKENENGSGRKSDVGLRVRS